MMNRQPVHLRGKSMARIDGGRGVPTGEGYEYLPLVWPLLHEDGGGL